MLAVQKLLSPAMPGEDSIMYDVMLHQERALIKVISKLQKQVDTACAHETHKTLHLFLALPAVTRQYVLKHPLYHHWWFQLSHYYKESDRQKMERWLFEFARFVTIPALQQGSWPEDGLLVPLSQAGELRFPGHLRHIVLPRVSVPSLARLRRYDNTLIITYEEQQHTIDLAELLTLDRDITHPLLHQRLSIQGTGIEVDSSDPWTKELLDTSKEPDAGALRSEGDTQPVPVQMTDIRLLEDTLLFLQQCWPEMYNELSAYVYLIAPFKSSLKSAFTNTIWSGAVFLRSDFRNQLHNLERLVHEGSHLRLNIIMTNVTLHYHGWNDRVPSPFRSGLRPITGLYHGAFVFTRVAQAMSRAFDLSGDMAYRQRIPQVVNQVVQALVTLQEQVRLTPEGQSLLDEISVEVEALQRQYPLQPENTNTVYDPYLQEW